MSEDIKIQQAFNIYTVGEYSFMPSCPSPGYVNANIVFENDKVMLGSTVCDIAKVDISNSPAGLKITLNNCRSYTGNVARRTIVIEAKTNTTTFLHGWRDEPLKIYKCQKKSRKESK